MVTPTLFRFDGELDPACHHWFLLLLVQCIIKRFSLTLIQKEMFEPARMKLNKDEMAYSSNSQWLLNRTHLLSSVKVQRSQIMDV